MKIKKSKLEQLLLKTIKSESGCMEWTGSLNSGGYGCSTYKGKTHGVHRIIYMIYKGDIPEGLYVIYSCDNRKCINIGHLSLGTQKDNMQDAIKKGRFGGCPRGYTQTHCINGHEYVEGSYYLYGRKRQCKLCNKLKNKRNYIKRKNKEISNQLED